jgi:hypothetical protein
MVGANERNKMSGVSLQSKDTIALARLPAEILQNIVSYLGARDLARLSSTCRLLFVHATDEALWARLVNANLPVKIDSPGSFGSFRDLYAAYHPCWFIPRNKIWFSDVEHTGKLVLARFDQRRGVIEGFRLVAEKGPDEVQQWELDPNVLIETFEPKVRLWLDDPVLYLPRAPPGRCRYLRGEVRMPMSAELQSVYSSFSLCSANIPSDLSEVAPEDVWPPVTIPSENRVIRFSTRDGRWGQRGTQVHLDSMSESAFRVRKWAHFMNLTIFPVGSSQENVQTFATLDPSLYTPTKEKPYQGIWVGEYSLHGCEFLLFLQRDKEAAVSGHPSVGSSPSSSEQTSNEADGSSQLFASNDDSNDSEPVEQGRLEAIKLTGDPNVPRGQISFVAEDIGPDGLIRIADEDMFKGARVVRSKGHVASLNFTDGVLTFYQCGFLSSNAKFLTCSRDFRSIH